MSLNNPLFEIASDTYKDLLRPCISCRLCGMFREKDQSFKTTCGLPDAWITGLRDLPDDCWRPVGTVLIWDSKRVE